MPWFSRQLPSRVLDFAWRRFGSGNVSSAELVDPAVACARDGYVLGPFRHRALRRHARAIRRDATATRLFLAEAAALPRRGTTLRSDPLLGGGSKRADRGRAPGQDPPVSPGSPKTSTWTNGPCAGVVRYLARPPARAAYQGRTAPDESGETRGCRRSRPSPRPDRPGPSRSSGP
ncbi:MAG: gamma-glutamyltransferase [Acidobacteria bacterium]|nr:gamma-glutamyltransferase [Acidobacteriota bacterium]